MTDRMDPDRVTDPDDLEYETEAGTLPNIEALGSVEAYDAGAEAGLEAARRSIDQGLAETLDAVRDYLQGSDADAPQALLMEVADHFGVPYEFDASAD